MLCTLFWTLVVIGQCRTGFSDTRKMIERGPTIKTEPTSRVEFSDSDGSELQCVADGYPPPKIQWLTKDGELASDVPGLRYQRGTKDPSALVFAPFTRPEYRQDVHDAVYQCAASNDLGSVLSREVHLKAVVTQKFLPQVYDVIVTRDNTAVLKCVLPSFAREYVVVDAWERKDGVILKPSEDYERGRSYVVLRSGELLIHNVRDKDSEWSYRCQTRHRLNGQIVPSETKAKITVNEPQQSTLPTITFERSHITAEEGSVAELPCVATGNPPPSYRWVKEIAGVLLPVKEDEGRIWTVHGLLIIGRVHQSDAGQYLCIARNSIGEKRIETTLIVTAPIVVHLRPHRMELSVGQEATFHCNVTGYPLHQITWMKDRQPVIAPNSGRIRLLSENVLHVTAVRREDRGMYQCFAKNDHDSAQDTSELHIADAPPVMISFFQGHTVEPGDRVSMKCVTTGNPLPIVSWHLDGELVGRKSPRIYTNDYVTEPDGHVVSHLNISETRLEDSGYYSCKATNDLGSTTYGERLNVRGPVFARPLRNVTSINGRDLVLRCPYGGHPIRSIHWYHDGALLPKNLRQKVNHTGVLLVQSVERSADEGQYTCTATHADGHPASTTTYLSVVVSPVIEKLHLRERMVVNEFARTKLVCVVNEGDPPLQFRWQKDDRPFLAHGDTTVQTFEDSSIVTFKKVTAADRGAYNCVVSNKAGSANMSAQLVVNVPPQWTIEPRNTTAVLGRKVWIDCGANGYPPPSIIWKKLIRTESTAEDFSWVHSGARVHRFNNGTLKITNVAKEDAGSYLCQAENGIGAGISQIILLKVLVPPRFKESYGSKTVTEGADIVLTCSAEGDPTIHIDWRRNDADVDPKREPRYSIRKTIEDRETTSELHIRRTARVEDSGIYFCTATSDIGSDHAQRQLIVQGVPDKPVNLTVTDLGSRIVNLRWEVPFDGNSHRTGSVVLYKTSSIEGGSWTNDQISQLIVSGSDTSATLRSLTPVTTYLVRIVAENAIGKSPPSQVFNVTTREEEPSGSPREIQVQSTGAQSIKVSWKPPPEDTRHGRLLGYYVGHRKTFSGNYQFQKVETDPSDFHSTYITGLEPSTEYDIVVKAFNSAGTGPKSSRLVGLTLETAPPTSPTIKVLSSTTSTVDVSWEKDSRNKSAITDYKLHYRAEGEKLWREERLGRLDHYTVRNLKCGTRYDMFLTASNSIGTGEPSITVMAKTKGSAPMYPAADAFLTKNSTSVILHLSGWKSKDCPIKNITVLYKQTHKNQWDSSHIRNIDSRTRIIENLKPDQEYTLMVTAISEAGITERDFTFRTPPSTAASGPALSPAYGAQENDQPLYKHIFLVISVVVTSLVLVIVVFAVTLCLRKQSHDQRDRMEYERRIKSDTLMMNDINSKKMSYSTPSVKSSHYAIPSVKNADYAEPCECDGTVRHGSEGLFATIKRGPTRPLQPPPHCKPDVAT